VLPRPTGVDGTSRREALGGFFNTDRERKVHLRASRRGNCTTDHLKKRRRREDRGQSGGRKCLRGAPSVFEHNNAFYKVDDDVVSGSYRNSREKSRVL